MTTMTGRARPWTARQEPIHDVRVSAAPGGRFRIYCDPCPWSISVDGDKSMKFLRAYEDMHYGIPTSLYPEFTTQKDKPMPPVKQPERPLLTPAEVARAFAVNPKSVIRWAKQGRLNYVLTPGGHRRYFEDEVRARLNGGQR